VESVASGYTERTDISKKAAILAEMTDRRNLSPVPSLALSDADYGNQPANRHSTLQGYL
jgi:hypothetical protein